MASNTLIAVKASATLFSISVSTVTLILSKLSSAYVGKFFWVDFKNCSIPCFSVIAGLPLAFLIAMFENMFSH